MQSRGEMGARGAIFEAERHRSLSKRDSDVPFPALSPVLLPPDPRRVPEVVLTREACPRVGHGGKAV